MYGGEEDITKEKNKMGENGSEKGRKKKHRKGKNE